MDVLVGADFFTVEVLTWRGLVTYYVLFFIEVGSRRVRLGGITRHPESWWMQQVARNATMEDSGYLNGCRYLLHDRDQKFCREFRETLAAGGVKCLRLPARSPNLNVCQNFWNITTKRETTKVRTTFCSSPPLLRCPLGDLESTVENASAAYFGTTAAPYEYFDQKSFRKPRFIGAMQKRLQVRSFTLRCSVRRRKSLGLYRECDGVVKQGSRLSRTPAHSRYNYL
jgi:hypothetical protein